MGKNVTIVVAIAAGLSGAAAVHHWPEYASAIQMAIYSLMVVVPLVPAFWPDRHHPRYLAAMSLALIAHVVILFAVRSVFPFRTVLEIIPIALVEFTVLAFIVIKVRGERDTSAGRGITKQQGGYGSGKSAPLSSHLPTQGR